MKIHAYRVHQRGPRALEDVLGRLHELPMEERYFEGRATGVRLEAFQRRDGLIYADFAIARTGHGPGKLSRQQAMSEISLGEGESFGEDTGLVFDPDTGYLVLQYNHVGPRSGRIEQYLFAADLSFGGLGPRQEGQSDMDRCGFGFGVVLKPDAYRRLQEMGIIRKLEFSVSVPGARANDRIAGRSLSQVLDAPLPEGIETLNVTMVSSAQPNGRLNRRGVMGFINDLQALGPLLRRANVRGRRDEDSSVEGVDLVKDKLEKEALVALGAGGRYPRADRWRSLAATLRDWLADGDLPRLE